MSASFARLLPYQSQLLQTLQHEENLSDEQIEIIVTEHEISGSPLESILPEISFIDEERVFRIISRMHGKEFINICDLPTNHIVLNEINISVAKKLCFVPLINPDIQDEIIIAMSDISDITNHDKILDVLSNFNNIKIVVAAKQQILERLNSIDTSDQKESHKEDFSSKFLDRLLDEAISKSASDIHLEPDNLFVRVRYRMEGILYDSHVFHQKFWSSICVRVKVLSGMDISEGRRPQDGRFTMKILGKNIDFRVSSHPTMHGESLVIRILDKSSSIFSLEKLGYPDHCLSKINDCIKKPDGMIILTGPTGSGKTTSLYSMISMLDAKNINIMTLEEPIEYKIPRIRQSEVKETLSFVDGMRSILRQDPDVILIGEIREKETAHMAMRAVMTGHKVFTTLHTNNALSAVYRFLDFGISITLLAGNITAIIAQRLIRMLCNECKEPCKINGKEIYKPVGCKNCFGSGYKGRQAVCEIITMDSDLEQMMLSRVPYEQMTDHLSCKGFRSLLEEGMALVFSGKTSLQEVQRVIGT